MPIYLDDADPPIKTMRTLARWMLRPLLMPPRTPPASARSTVHAPAFDQALALERCDRCWYSREGVGHQRECHRRPPALVYDDEHDMVMSAFPGVDDAEWCGEFRAR